MSKQVNIFLDDDVYERLKERADSEYRSMPKTIEMLVEQFLDGDK